MKDFAIKAAFSLALMVVGVMIYVGVKDEMAFKDTEVKEIHEIKVTKVTDRYISFLYWFDDKKIREGSVNFEDIEIGDEIKLGVKIDTDYILAPIWYGHKEIQYLYLPEQMIKDL